MPAALPYGTVSNSALEGMGKTGISLGGLTSAASGAEMALGAAASIAKQLIGAFEEFINKAASWVSLLSPQTMALFNQSLKDLQATLGVAFKPIFEIMTGVFRQIAGIILPVMEQLRPVIEQLTEIFASNLAPSVQMFAALIQALIPILQAFAVYWEFVQATMRPVIAVVTILLQALGFALKLVMVALTPLIIVLKILEGFLNVLASIFDAVGTVLGALMDGIMALIEAALTPLMIIIEAIKVIFDAFGQVIQIIGIIFKTVIQTVVEALVAFINSLFGGMNVKDAMDGLRKAIHTVIEYMLLFVAAIAKGLGMDSFLKNLIKNLQPKQGAHAAAGPGSIKSFEQIAKDMSTASATAAGAGGKDSSKIDLSDILKETSRPANHTPLGTSEPGPGRFRCGAGVRISRHPVQKKTPAATPE